MLVAARAEAAGMRVGVPEFEGAQEAAVRMKVMQLLKSHGFEPVRSREMQEAMLLTGAGLDSDDGLKALAKELALSAIVTGEVRPKRAKIVVHDGGGGAILGDASFSGANPRKLVDEVDLTFWKKLGPDVERGHVAAGAKKRKGTSKEAAARDDEGAPEGEADASGNEGKAAAEGSKSDEAPPGKKVKTRRRLKMEESPPEEAGTPFVLPAAPWLDFELGVGGLNRSLTFAQDVASPGYAILRPYSLSFGPIGAAKLVLYPWLAGKVGNFGVEAEIQQGVGISSTLSTGGSFNDTVHEYAGGLRYRALFASTDDLFFSLTFGEDAFTFNGPNRGSLATPDTIYHYTRLGTGMHVMLSDRIGISFGVGYRLVTNHAGPQISQDVFPHLTVAGADVEIGARYALSGMFEVRAGLEWRRYWYDTHSQPGDLVMASSAVDQSVGFTVGIAVLLGVGNAPKAGGGAEQAPPPPPSPTPKPRSGRKPSDEEESSGEESDAGEPSPSVDDDGNR